MAQSTNTVTTYCTPEDVSMALDLPDRNDHYGVLTFSDQSHPSYEQVCRMIRSNEDIIDRRMRRTWRENFVKDQVLTIQEYWADTNGWRSDYYQRGGHYVQLRKDIREWDPRMRLAEETKEKTLSVDEGKDVKQTDVITVAPGRKGKVKAVEPVSSESGLITGYKVEYYPVLWEGDRLEIRTRNNTWRNISTEMNPEEHQSHDSTYCFFDYPYGKLYLRTRLYQQKANALRISYRYGSTDEPPEAIRRLCCLMTAIQVLNMQIFSIKIGASGDLGQIKKIWTDNWQTEINDIYSSFQRSGSVHAMWS